MAEIATEQGHWYDKGGKPAYTIIGKNGKERNTTLRDARELGLVGSVTSIVQVMAKPGLDIWKRNQLLYAAATLPKIEGESVDDWCNRVVADSQEQGKAAKDRGTAIHGYIEKYLQDKPTPKDYARHCYGVSKALAVWIGGMEAYEVGDNADVEKSFTSGLGYGGKVDFSCPGFVADFKTTDKPLDKIKTWDEHAMQLAAYRGGLGMPEARCAIIYIHVDGDTRLIELTEAGLARGWQMFLMCFELWKAQKRYWPGLGE